MLKDIDTLTDHDHIIKCIGMMPASVRPVLAGMFHPDVSWELPDGDPPYKKSEADVPAMLHQEARRLYLFWKNGNPNLSPMRRETLFINLLESLNDDDAKLILACKARKQDYFKHIQGYHFARAFPDQAALAAYPEPISNDKKAKKSKPAERKGNDAPPTVS